MQNAKFETFYKESGLIPESEWEQFMETVRRKLPTTFRITGTRRFVRLVQACTVWSGE
jgi:multisite-specific tRNA:(cytosine-C5)-methyltransferase